ncbi:MAG: adenosylmethionine--8-amino-7-oxononanoate transaminase [Methylococcales bacterium]|nr:adenosylmethionine--8-amino-7-oxononanoate transaminase [Methylococcales bacterium]
METIIKQDRQVLWHPYSAIGTAASIYPVASAAGVRLKLMDGSELIDGMSSWWSAIHGYNHPKINAALNKQIQTVSHVMFGGLTHQPAVDLATQLVAITPASLTTVFFSDSGSVAVEVAMKMAIQYWYAQGQPNKSKMLTIRNGYHGDTFGAMSVSDPVNGMHGLFAQGLVSQFFADAPQCGFDDTYSDQDTASVEAILEKHHAQIAAFILEPIVQGAGGMRFYSPRYLSAVRALCDRYDVLLIFDEIATGFGRTGKLFALEHGPVIPDILCLGKALTGGYLTLAATLVDQKVATTISAGDPGVFMHGPTFMANPLACCAGLASLQLLLDSPWQQRIKRISAGLAVGLAPCRQLPQVKDVRVLGAIGVVEMHEPIVMETLQPLFVENGVWLRPFNRLVYLMPPYIISDTDLKTLTNAVVTVLSS